VCKSVSVVARSSLKARKALIDAAASSAKIQFVWDSEAECVLGEAGVSAIRLRHAKTGATRELPCFGVFPFIGTEPNTEFLDGFVDLTQAGYIKTDAELQTSVSGVFAIGAVREGHSGALVSAAGDGARVVHRIIEERR
jgi:thioredoxin reductase (NADPH)